MKKHTLLLIILGFWISSHAQINDNEYASVYFYCKPLQGDRSVEVTIENQRKFLVIGNQLIVFRVFTTGKIDIKSKNVSAYASSYSSAGNTITLDIVAGKNYFIESQFSDYTQLFFKTDSFSVSRKYKKSDLDTVWRYETEENPIRERKKKKTEVAGSGTGFLISTTGVVITNSHVVQDAKKINVKVTDGGMKATLSATVIYDNKGTDVALLQLEQSNIKFDSIPYNFRSFGVQTGEEVFTLGYPMLTKMGTEIKLTNGIVSSTSGYQGSLSSYQISVPAQPGNSGSPVFDAQGNLIGIINSKIMGLEGVTYAIKSAFITPEIQAAKIPNKMQYPISTTKIPLVNLVNLYSKFIYIIEVEQ
jgi:V8-like Glu-specific endopeptidase